MTISCWRKDCWEGDREGREEDARGGDRLNWEWVKLIWKISEYDKQGRSVGEETEKVSGRGVGVCRVGCSRNQTLVKRGEWER